MEFLSLDEPVPEPAARLSRSDAVLISLGLHVALLLLVLFLPRHLPESVLAFFRARPVPVAIAEIRPAPPRRTPGPSLQPPRIPLQFTYVRIPNDQAAPRDPAARLFSDKSRRARQETPTPPDARRLSLDPHSAGNTANRVRPDPTRPEGPETPEPPPRLAGGRGGSAEGTADRRTAPGKGGASAAAPPPQGSGPVAAARGEGGLEPRSGTGPGEGGGAGPQDLKQALQDVRSGEYKFMFNNPAYLKGSGNYGTLSFDTQDFPWGDYARRMYVIILNNWLARYPLAAREVNLHGVTCLHYVIERGGSISSIDPVRLSSVPPFDRVAEGALRASSPLPPLPTDFPGEREGITACFYYNMMPGEDD